MNYAHFFFVQYMALFALDQRNKHIKMLLRLFMADVCIFLLQRHLFTFIHVAKRRKTVMDDRMFI